MDKEEIARPERIGSMNKVITVRLPEELHNQVKQVAQKMGIPISDLINLILNDYLDNAQLQQ